MSKIATITVVPAGLDEALAALRRLATFIAEYPAPPMYYSTVGWGLPHFPHRRGGIKSRYKGKVRYDTTRRADMGDERHG